MDVCPSEAVLIAYAEGRLGDADSPALMRHVSACSTCSKRISSAIGSVGTVPEAAALPASRERIGRYRLARLLGAGGMGAVYEAHDEELDRRVAIKLLRERWSEQEPTVDRLRREAKAMAKLAHPNVVAVHDVGVTDGQPYLSMEFIDGVTLSMWLEEKQRPWSAVVDVFVQAGRGLAAAHAVGIVHRDVKPENILIARDGRVCVTDFGIAARERDADDGRILGTPAYMAPEQMTGGVVDARTDVFGFCVALYEALYGTRPFTATTLTGLQEAIRTQAVNAPLRRGAPTWVREALLRGLRAAPDERHPTMAAVLERLDRRRRSGAWRRRLAVLALVLVAGAAVGLWRWEARRASLVSLLGATGTTRVAIVVDGPAGGVPDGADALLAPLVGGALGGADRVVLADPDLVARAAAAQKAHGRVDPQRIAAAAGAARVVVIDTSEGAIRATVHDSVPGTTPLASASERITPGTWLDAAHALAVDVAGDFGAPKAAAIAGAASAAPREPNAALALARGLRALQAHDLGLAASLLDEACRADLSSVAACARRAAILEDLGNRGAAIEAARQALARAAAAPKQVQLETEAIVDALAGDHDAAIALYREAWSSRPDDRARAIALAREQQAAGRPKDAVATVEGLRARGVPAGTDPELDLFEASVREALGDRKASVTLARGTVAQAESLDDAWLGARARNTEAKALFNSGQAADAEALEKVARQTFVDERDQDAVAWADLYIAIFRRRAGDLATARTMMEAVLAQAAPLGDRLLERHVLNYLTTVYRRSDDLELAATTIARAVALWREAGDDRSLASTLNVQCGVVGSHGDLRDGAPACDEALAIRRRLGDRSGVADALGNVALLEHDAGKSASAEGSAREALTIALELGSGTAHLKYELAALIADDKSRLSEAEPLARAALAERGTDTSEAGDDLAMHALLGRILAESGRADDARAEVAAAEKALALTSDREARLNGEVDLARARLANHPTPTERQAIVSALTDLDAEATKAQWLGFALDARRVRAEARGSREQLAAVEQEALGLGRGMCARLAREALEHLPPR
jgi:tetratricopeptide (TPR) repeat protein